MLEEASFLSRHENKNDFNPKTYDKKKEVFDVIVFESDQDLDPKIAHFCYDDRWLLELVFNRFKNDECLDGTSVQGDFSLIGSEFINFISTVIACRLIKKARAADLLSAMSYEDLMVDLNLDWRKVDVLEAHATDDNGWVHTNVGVFEEMEALGLSRSVRSLNRKSVVGKRKNPRKTSRKGQEGD